MPDIAPRDTSKEWLKAILIWAFMASWIFFFSFSLYASGCHKFKRPASERLSRCENSLRFTGFIYTKHQRATNLIHQGIAQSELGADAKALALFSEAIQLLHGSYPAHSKTLHLKLEALSRAVKDPAILPHAHELFQTAIDTWAKGKS